MSEVPLGGMSPHSTSGTRACTGAPRSYQLWLFASLSLSLSLTFCFSNCHKQREDQQADGNTLSASLVRECEKETCIIHHDSHAPSLSLSLSLSLSFSLYLSLSLSLSFSFSLSSSLSRFASLKDETVYKQKGAGQICLEWSHISRPDGHVSFQWA